MSNCPKCGEGGLSWVRTKNKKNWLKADLGDGQTGKDWHTCKTQLIPDEIIRPFCHECKTKLTGCEEYDCQLCKYAKSFCNNCDTHVSVVEMK